MGFEPALAGINYIAIIIITTITMSKTLKSPMLDLDTNIEKNIPKRFRK